MNKDSLVNFPLPGRLIKMKERIFDTEVAVQVGVNESMFLSNLHFWLSKTKAGKSIGGIRWIYNTHEQWLEHFPFWSKRTLQRVVESLKAKGLIEISNFNKLKRDKTLWYTINYSHEVITKWTKWPHDMANLTTSIVPTCPDASGQNGHPIPYTQDTEVNTEKDDSTGSSSSALTTPTTAVTQAVGSKDKLVREDSNLTQKQESRISYLWYQKLTDEDKFEVDAYLREEIVYRKVANPEGYKRTIIRRVWRKNFGLNSDTSFYWKDGRLPNELQDGVHLQYAVSRAELHACESI